MNRLDAQPLHTREALVSALIRFAGGPGGPLDEIAARHNATVAQIALAWLLARSEVMLPIPGASSVEHLEEKVPPPASLWKANASPTGRLALGATDWATRRQDEAGAFPETIRKR